MEKDRLDRLNKLKEEVALYPSVEGETKGLLFNKEAQYQSLEEVKKASLSESVYQGRVVQINNLGKCMFIQLKFDDSLWQIFIERVKEKPFKLAKLLQTGDLIRAYGNTFKTSQGKVCLYVDDLQFCSKALIGTGKVLQDKNEIDNTELLRRKRYVDYIMNGTKELRIRHNVIRSIRNYLDGKDYVEVETRILQPVNSGANAKPFVTKYNSVGEDFFLRVAPELDLKRLIVGGLERVYEIGKCFRNEGMSNKHNPEFTSLEVYTSFSDYKDAYGMTVEIIDLVFDEIGVTLDHRYITIEGALKKLGVEYTYENMMNIFEEKVEPKMRELYKNELVIVEGFPTYSCPLAKKCQDDKYIERFEVYYNGMEIANGYSELNDPQEQRKRFEEQQLQKDKMDLDEDFLEALEYGMPPTSGFGIGIDRLMMILLGEENIKDVIPFPPYKNK